MARLVGAEFGAWLHDQSGARRLFLTQKCCQAGNASMLEDQLLPDRMEFIEDDIRRVIHWRQLYHS